MKQLRPKHLSHAERAERRRLIAGYVNDGGTVGAAAAHYGVSYEIARTSCREHGVQPPRQVGFRCSARSFEILAALMNSSLPGATIAKQHGVTPQRVDQIRKDAQKAGIVIPRYAG